MSAPQELRPLPWSGSRARTRDRGYAEAMGELFRLVRDLQNGPLPADEALHLLGSYCFDAWAMGDQPVIGLEQLEGWLGNWEAPGSRAR